MCYWKELLELVHQARNEFLGGQPTKWSGGAGQVYTNNYQLMWEKILNLEEQVIHIEESKATVEALL